MVIIKYIYFEKTFGLKIKYFCPISGSHLYSLQIRPKNGVKLINWNLLDNLPEPNEFLNEKAYFAMVTHGVEAPPLQVTLEFEVKIKNNKAKKVSSLESIFFSFIADIKQTCRAHC